MNSSVKTDCQASGIKCKITHDYEILRKSSVFSEADSDVLKLFAYLAKRKQFHPGEQIIKYENHADMAFLLVSGRAELTTIHKNREVVLQELEPDTLCGELALLSKFDWFFNVRAVEECETIIITRESFQKVLEKFPDKKDKIVERIIQLRIQKLVEQTSFILDKIPENHLKESSILSL